MVSQHRPRRRPSTLALTLVLATVWLASGLYSVAPDQSAVGFVLGRAAARDVPPGIHWNIPWPLGRVTVAPTATNFVMPVGFRLLPRPEDPPTSDLWLTGDANIVAARLNFMYRIHSLSDFLLAHESPRELIRRAGERALTDFLVSVGVDAAMTSRRHELLVAVQAGVQRSLNDQRIGVDIQSVTIELLGPPDDGGVRGAFQEVQDALADRERTIQEAGAYRVQALAEADGNAQRLRSEGAAERYRRIEIARGRTARFRALAAAHALAPAVTEQRLYLETLDRILPRIETYVIEPAPGNHVHLRIEK